MSNDISRFIEQTLQIARHEVAREKIASAHLVEADEAPDLSERSAKLAAVYDALSVEGLSVFGSVSQIEKDAKCKDKKGKYPRHMEEEDSEEDSEEDDSEMSYKAKSAEDHSETSEDPGFSLDTDDVKSTRQTQAKSQEGENEYTRQKGPSNMLDTDEDRSVTGVNPISVVHKTARQAEIAQIKHAESDPAFHAMASLYQARLSGNEPEIDKIAEAFGLDESHVQALDDLILEKESQQVALTGPPQKAPATPTPVGVPDKARAAAQQRGVLPALQQTGTAMFGNARQKGASEKEALLRGGRGRQAPESFAANVIRSTPGAGGTVAASTASPIGSAAAGGGGAGAGGAAGGAGNAGGPKATGGPSAATPSAKPKKFMTPVGGGKGAPVVPAGEGKGAPVVPVGGGKGTPVVGMGNGAQVRGMTPGVATRQIGGPLKTSSDSVSMGRDVDDGHDTMDYPRGSDESPTVSSTGDGTYAPGTSPMTPFLDSAAATTAFTKRQAKVKSSMDVLNGLFSEAPFVDSKLHENLSAASSAGVKMSRK